MDQAVKVVQVIARPITVAGEGWGTGLVGFHVD
jgi:hypothetical protein